MLDADASDYGDNRNEQGHIESDRVGDYVRGGVRATGSVSFPDMTVTPGKKRTQIAVTVSRGGCQWKVWDVVSL